jgi:hypothetical protein
VKGSEKLPADEEGKGSHPDDRRRERRQRLVRALAWAVAGAATLVLVHGTVTSQIDLVAVRDGALQVSDFVYHVALVAEAWFGEGGSPYRLETQRQVLSALAGSRIDVAMPVGVTPLALLVWLPFAALFRIDPGLANSAWLSLSITVLAFALWRLQRRVASRRGETPFFGAAFLVVALLSQAMVRAVVPGQTTLLATGVLLLLCVELVEDGRDGGPRLMRILLYGLLLSLKPPYLMLGLGLLLCAGQRRVAAMSGAGLLALTLLVCARFGWEMMGDYLDSLALYSQTTLPDFYRSSVVPHTMILFRYAFEGPLGPARATAVTHFVGVAGAGAILGIAMLRGEGLRASSGEGRAGARLFVLLAATYLLFSPYAGSFEDLLVLVPAAAVVLARTPLPGVGVGSLVTLLALGLVLNHHRLPPGKPMWLLWILKAGIFAYLFWLCSERRLGVRREIPGLRADRPRTGRASEGPPSGRRPA